MPALVGDQSGELGTIPLLTVILSNLRDTLSLPSELLMFLLVVVVPSVLGGVYFEMDMTGAAGIL